MSILIHGRVQHVSFARWRPRSVSDEIRDALSERTDFIVGAYPLERIALRYKTGRVFLRRHGALGDIVVLFPAIRAIKRQLPYTFSLACGSQYLSLFQNDDTFDEVIVTGQRPTKEIIGEIRLDGILERDLTWDSELEAPRPEFLVPRALAYYQFLTRGFDLPETFTPDYSLRTGSQDAVWAHSFMDNLQRRARRRPIIFVQARGSGPVRSIGRERMRAITIRLSKKYNIIVTDKSENYCWRDEARGIFPAYGQRPWLNIIELMRLCDAALVTDSGIQWLAHVAGIPMVSILGPTRATEKISTHPLYPRRVRGIDTAALYGCKTCFENAFRCKWKYSCLHELDLDVLYENVAGALEGVIGNVDKRNGNQDAGA